MQRFNAVITTISPVFVGGFEKTGNISLPYFIHAPHTKQSYTVEKEKLEMFLKCVGAFYRNCNKDSFGSRSFTEAFKDRVYVALCTPSVSQFFTSLTKHLPIGDNSFYQYTTKFTFALSEIENRTLMQWARDNLDMFVAAAVYMTESFNFKEGFEISDDMLVTQSDYFIPTIPGNTIRGIMRDQLMSEMTHLVFDCDDPHKIFNKKVYDTLFSGGRLESSTGFVNIEAKRDLRERLPFLSILGTMKGNEDLSGKLNVNFARLQCLENESGERPAMSFLKEYFMTRTDDYEGAVTEDDKTAQMMYSALAIEKGAAFDWSVDCYYLSDLERMMFDLMMHTFVKTGKVGGMNRAGFGEISVYCDTFDPFPALDWLKENRDDIKSSLEEILS